MEEFRSNSCKDEELMQMGISYTNGRSSKGMHDLRSYSTPHASLPSFKLGKELKIKEIKTRYYNNNGSVSSSSSKIWGLSDPELQRKKRVASYKAYALEGKMKNSLRKSFKWIKNTCIHLVHGSW
ncbi:uncharacterized protein LOC124946206 [Impatiens glandulifera]|uniref:uncharacterized protein LOC124946206 n=1 Tax=Impatiens glandulifera TaxID=253017 RepID=UPI001FB0752C|nr:uncharacterized protein LOC124946206 [Impatiens glandulifera]